MKKNVQRRYRDDIENLKKHYGSLDGLEITESIRDFSKIVERGQVKISAYMGLLNHVKKIFNATITLYSKKTKQ